MKRVTRVFAALALLLAAAMPAVQVRTASADNLMADNFTGSTLSGNWLSGGNPTAACLTASTATTGAIHGCDSETAIDTVGNGALRLTDNEASQAGFVINQTPISTGDGLQVSFDMYQYDGNGADGIAFFLIDGSKSPTQPGAFGGSLGYSSNTDGDPGLVGGYVGVGFDVFGNFSSNQFGSGGTGAHANSITVRGSEQKNYLFVTTKPASGLLANNAATSRTNAKRHVIISISTNNIMTVYVDYENGQGPLKELSDINLNTINGDGSLPDSLKFGFSASTGGSNDIHEISGLSVDTLAPNVSAKASQGSNTFTQGETGQFTLAAKNDAGAESTSGTITVTDTLPAGLTPTAASGSGWTCGVSGQTVTCTRPGDGANALDPGNTVPDITVTVAVSNSAGASLSNTSYVATANNNPLNDAGFTNTFTVAAGDHDGASIATENAAPNGGDANNDGTLDSGQTNVTSFVNGLTGNYATLAADGCDQVNDPYMASAAVNATADTSFTYPVGMMNFSIDCDNPGDTATVTQYYYGDYDPTQYVARKYNTATHTYADIPGATVTSVTIGGQKALKITYDITDGGPLDADGTANGTIVDPAGPAIQNPATPASGGNLTDTGTNVLAVMSASAFFLTGALFIASRRSAKTH